MANVTRSFRLPSSISTSTARTHHVHVVERKREESGEGERGIKRKKMAGHHIVDEDILLEFTPTWIVALVCSIIVFISMFVERRLHFLGKFFKKKNQKTLYEALEKVKEELMLLGFMSLFLMVLREPLRIICIPRHWNDHMLPCSKRAEDAMLAAPAAAHYVVDVLGGPRRLLEEGTSPHKRHCRKGMVPLLSSEAVHQLHIFIFVLALTHVIFTVTTMFLGGAKIREWKHWEDSIRNENENVPKTITNVQQFEFIQNRYKGIGKESLMLQWLHSFRKQFYGSVTKSDYITMRFGFIMTHCQANPRFDFHKYMLRALEADFKKVVGISWYLWIFAIMFLLLNINGWHTYFWMAFIPLALLLAVGAKLEHVITQLAHDVAEKHSAVHGDLVVNPSDEHFWFCRPRIVLYLIHFILFQNAFQIAYFFWILTTYGFRACIMDKMGFIIPKLIIGVIIQILCSYSTLPLYAIVTQMGSSFKKAIFDEPVQHNIVGWAEKARKRASQLSRSSSTNSEDRPSAEVQMVRLLSRSPREESSMEQGKPSPKPSGAMTM